MKQISFPLVSIVSPKLGHFSFPFPVCFEFSSFGLHLSLFLSSSFFICSFVSFFLAIFFLLYRVS